MAAKLEFSERLVQSDPQKQPVLIIGQVKHLTKLKFDDIKIKLEPRVTEEIYNTAILSLYPSPTDTCSMYLNLATVAALPMKCSRHNTPSRSHAITKIIKSASVGVSESIVMVCERYDVFASACAIARAYPLFTRKTANSVQENPVTVSVEFFIMPDSEQESDMLDLGPELKLLRDTSVGIRLAAKIVDTPCNEMNVDHFLKEIENVCQCLESVTLKVIRGEELKEKGFGGIYGVGKAASVSPALAVLSYRVPFPTQIVAWVGKGIVFDTGGLSLKAKTSMPGMKRDCGGAAAILGAFYAAVQQGLSEELHAIFCLAENSVGSDATRPDDIHTLYSGRTVEINNTDAEGRLVLSDGVSYAHKDLKANIILDMATLTGAQGISTGKYHAALLTNSVFWEKAASSAGRISGDLVFPIPYCPELHISEFSSAIADMKNSVMDRNNAQSSCAGLFIGAHLGFDFGGDWIHIDMAYPGHCGERATGYGVALLMILFGFMSHSNMLKNLCPSMVQNGIEGGEGVVKKLKRN